MNGLNTGLPSPPQGARVAIVADDNRDAPLNAAIRKRIQQALKRRSLMRCENSNVHGWAGSVGLIAGGDWHSWVAKVQKVENIGEATDSCTSLDDRYSRRAEKHRTQTGILRTDDIPSRVVTHEDRVRRRDVYQFQRTMKRSGVWFPPADVSAEHRRVNPLEKPVARQLVPPYARAAAPRRVRNDRCLDPSLPNALQHRQGLWIQSCEDKDRFQERLTNSPRGGIVECGVFPKQLVESLVERADRAVRSLRVQPHGADEHGLVAFRVLRPPESIPALLQAPLQDSGKIRGRVVGDQRVAQVEEHGADSTVMFHRGPLLLMVRVSGIDTADLPYYTAVDGDGHTKAPDAVANRRGPGVLDDLDAEDVAGVWTLHALPPRVDAGITTDETSVVPHQSVRVTGAGLKIDRHHELARLTVVLVQARLAVSVAGAVIAGHDPDISVVVERRVVESRFLLRAHADQDFGHPRRRIDAQDAAQAQRRNPEFAVVPLHTVAATTITVDAERNLAVADLLGVQVDL